MDNSTLSHKLKAFSNSVLLARVALESFWYNAQGRAETEEVNFEALFAEFGKMLYFVDLLRLVPYSSDEDKSFHSGYSKEAMGVKALHNILYEEKKDELIARAKEVCEEAILFFESLKDDPDFLNFETKEDDDIQHPLLSILEKRDNFAWLIIGLRFLQTDDQYTSIDIESYDRRMKIVDLTLKRKILECVTYHFKDFQETMPFAPNEFWWRHIAGHEFQAE